MIDLKETIERAEAILRTTSTSAFVEAYACLRAGVEMYLEQQIVREPCPNHKLVMLAPGEFCAICANST
jgi:hypothetical protein